MQDLPWHNIWSDDNPVEVLNDHLLLLLGCFVPTKVIHVRNKDSPFLWSMQVCFWPQAGGPSSVDPWCLVDSLWKVCPLSSESLWNLHIGKVSVSCQKLGFFYKYVYCQKLGCSYKCLPSLLISGVTLIKSPLFGLSLSLPLLVGGGGVLVFKSEGKADLLLDHFDGKQSRMSVDLLLTCNPSPRLASFAFRLSEVRCLLLDLDLFPHFLN